MTVPKAATQPYVLSERSVDGGWHHLTLEDQALLRRLKLFSRWNAAVPTSLDGTVQAIGPASPILVIQCDGAKPLELVDLNQVARAASGDILFTHEAASKWRARSERVGSFASFGGASSLEQLRLRDHDFGVSERYDGVIDRVKRDAVLDELRECVGSSYKWQALVGHAPSAWRECIRSVPLTRIAHFPLVLPGLITMAEDGLGEKTVGELLSCAGRWEIPKAKQNAQVPDRPGLEALAPALKKTKTGTEAYRQLRELKAEAYDGLCLQERHLDRHARMALGEAIDKHAGSVGRSIALSPLMRTITVSVKAGFSARACRFASELGIDVYGDLGHYCYGLAMARAKDYRLDPDALGRAVLKAARQAKVACR